MGQPHYMPECNAIRLDASPAQYNARMPNNLAVRMSAEGMLESALSIPTPDENHPDTDAMAHSRAWDPSTPPRGDQAHILVIHRSSPSSHCSRCETYERNAGIASQYVGMLPLGSASRNLRRSLRRGVMEPGARIFVGVRCRLGACAIESIWSFGGLRPGTSRAHAVLLGRRPQSLVTPPLIQTGVDALVPGALVVSPSGGDPNSFLEYTADIRASIAAQLSNLLRSTH